MDLEDPVLDALCRELVAQHAVHSIILYGSRADGSHGEDSDYDVAAFGPRDEPLRIARASGRAWLDVWIYPTAALLDGSGEALRFRGGRVLLQRDREADDLLARVEDAYRRGPAPLSADEVAARHVWARKMLARIERADPEGHYRRLWLLQALLEDYFQCRGTWFEGPKKALRWLARHDPPFHAAYCAAIEPDADFEAIARLVDLVDPPRGTAADP